MSDPALQGTPVPVGQQLPGAIVADLREYAASLGLPTDWFIRVEVRIQEDFATASRICTVAYGDKPFATYSLDMLGEIKEVVRHVPIPVPPDPLVVATELALQQPKDPEWRRFRHLTFRKDEVMFVNNVDKEGHENGNTFTICFRGRDLVCSNQKNYANSGMSTCEFFLTHVMELAPEHRHQP